MAELRLKTGELVLVDDEDLPKVEHIKWYRHKQGYAMGYIPVSRRGAADNKLVLMHQLILPGAKFTDHWNGNRLDNQKHNLRRTDEFGNGRNVSVRVSATKTSRFKGVCWHRGVGKWMARVAREYVGVYTDEIEAARAYNAVAQERFGEFAKLNQMP